MPIRAVLRLPAYRLLWSAQAISDIGDALTYLTLMLLVNEVSGGSTALLALMTISLAVPQFTIGLYAGVVVDRVNRRTAMLAADAARAVLLLVLAGVTLLGTLPPLFVVAALVAAAGTFFMPARGATIPRIVPAEGLPAANSLAQSTRIVASVIGTGLGGLLFSVLGPEPAFLIDAATFAASFLLVARLPRSLGTVRGDRGSAGEMAGAGEPPAAGVAGSFREGIAIVRRSRLLVGALLSAAILMLGLGAVNVLLVPLFVNELGVQPAWLALGEVAQTASMIMASAIIAWLVTRLAPTTILSLGLFGLAGFTLALAGVTELWHVLLLLFTVGWFTTPTQAAMMTIVQTASTDATRGRVVSLLGAGISTSNVLSMAFAGLFGEVLGVQGVFLTSGAIIAVGALVSVLLFRGTAGRPLAEEAAAA
jgi:MFS family permease